MDTDILFVTILSLLFVVYGTSRGCPLATPPLRAKLRADITRWVVFSCDSGYQLEGDKYLYCTSISCCSFYRARPKCVKTDKPPCPILTLNNGLVYQNGSAFFSCQDNFHLIGKSVLYCINGVWSGEVPICEPINEQCRVPVLKNGRVTLRGSAYFYCNDNYIIRGNPVLRCVDGVWDGEVPTCKLPNCGVPPKINHSTLSSVSSRKIVLLCNVGYRDNGMTVELICTVSETWTTVVCAQEATVTMRPRIKPTNEGTTRTTTHITTDSSEQYSDGSPDGDDKDDNESRQHEETGSNSIMVPAVIGAFLAIVVVAIVVAVFILIRRRLSGPPPEARKAVKCPADLNTPHEAATLIPLIRQQHTSATGSNAIEEHPSRLPNYENTDIYHHYDGIQDAVIDIISIKDK